jgi:hypothetical protein
VAVLERRSAVAAALRLYGIDLGRRGLLPLAFDPAVIARWQSQGEAALGVLHAHLASRNFLVGEAATIADICCYGEIAFARLSGNDLVAWPQVVAWAVERNGGGRGFGYTGGHFHLNWANDTVRKMVLNAFMRRGYKVAATQGIKIVYWGGFPARPGYSPLNMLPFSPQVEDYD